MGSQRLIALLLRLRKGWRTAGKPGDGDRVARDPFPEDQAEISHIGAKAPTYPNEPSTAPDAATALATPVDTALDGFTAGALTVRAVSVKGDSHRLSGQPRQDAFAVVRMGAGGDGFVLAVVADGVGSAALSHVGAALACECVVAAVAKDSAQILRALIAQDRDLMAYRIVHAIDDACGRITAEAKRLRYPASDLATTVRGVLASTDDTVQHRVAFHVGDGGTYRLSENGWHSVTDDKSDALIISTATAALPSQPECLRFVWWETCPDEATVVCTDGFSGPLAEAGFAEILKCGWTAGEVPGLARFTWLAQTRVRSYDDDRTVAVLWPIRTSRLP